MWRVGPRAYAASVSVAFRYPMAAEHFKRLLRDVPHLAHVLVEVNECFGVPCKERTA